MENQPSIKKFRIQNMRDADELANAHICASRRTANSSTNAHICASRTVRVKKVYQSITNWIFKDTLKLQTFKALS